MQKHDVEKEEQGTLISLRKMKQGKSERYGSAKGVK